MRPVFLPAAALVLALAALALAAGPKPQAPPPNSPGPESPAAQAPAPCSPAPEAQAPMLHMDQDLAREHERFSRFAADLVQRMNATMLGGRQSMQVTRGADGLFHASYKAIDPASVVCQVRRAESDPRYFVGTLLFKEQVLQSRGSSAEACRKGSFAPVSEKANRIIYTSRRGGGWQ